MKMIMIFGLLFSSTVFGMKLTKEETSTLENCMKSANKNCERDRDPSKCLSQSIKSFQGQCQKVFKKSSMQNANMGSSCLGLFKICPMKVGTSADDFKQFEECVAKNLDKVPKACQNTMAQMYKANTGEKKSYADMMKEIKKNDKNGKNVQVKNK